MPLKSYEFRGGLDYAKPWNDFDFSLLQSQPLYFYVGAGLSMAAGLVGWGEMARILWWYLTHYEKYYEQHYKGKPIKYLFDRSQVNAKFLDDFVNKPFPPEDKKAPRILSRDNGDQCVLGRVALLNMLLRYRAPRTKLIRDSEIKELGPKEGGRVRCGEEPIAEDLILHSLIWRTNCHGVLTPNYDMLLEHAFSLFNHGAALRSYRYNAEFLRYIMSNRQFVLKLHGDINDISSMLFNPKNAWKQGTKNNPSRELADFRGDDLKEVYKTALQEGHMVYVGMGFRDYTIFELHKYWRENNTNPAKVRVAIIPRGEINAIKRENEKMERENGGQPDPCRFNDIIFLTYKRGEEPAHVVREILSRIAHVRSHLTYNERHSCPEATDIHSQIFLSEPSEHPGQRWQTDLWTCKGKEKP